MLQGSVRLGTAEPSVGARDWLGMRWGGLVCPHRPKKAPSGACMEDGVNVGCESPPGSSVPHSTVCLSHHGLLNSFRTELRPQLTALLWLRQIHLPGLTFVLAPWLTVSSWRARGQTEWYFMSVCKTHTGASVFGELYAALGSSYGWCGAAFQKPLSGPLSGCENLQLEPTGWKVREKQPLLLRCPPSHT